MTAVSSAQPQARYPVSEVARFEFPIFSPVRSHPAITSHRRSLAIKAPDKDGFAPQQVWYWTMDEVPSKYWKYMEGWAEPEPSKY